MFNIISGIAKIALSPIRGVAQLASTIAGNESENDESAAILSIGIAPILKGTLKGIVEGTNDIFNK